MSRSLTHAALALFVAASLAVLPLGAQNQQTPVTDQPPTEPQGPPPAPARSLNFGPDYSKNVAWFPNILAPHTPIHVPKPELTNTPRVEQLISDGKLTLSIEDAISLALENNLGIAVARYTPWLNEASLLLAKSGANGRLAFDPTISSTLSWENSTTPFNNPLFAGVTTLSTSPIGVANHVTTGNFSYTQGFATGTQAQVTFDNSRTSTNLAAFDLFNPYLQSTLTLELTQPLLNGFGKLPNERYIIEAKNTIKAGESQFGQQVITIVTQVATDYWELVYARENVKVEQGAVAADQQLYDNNRRQVEIGSMAPPDVTTAASQLAADQQALVQAQTTQLVDEATLLVAITRDPLDMELKGVEILPTTPIFNPAAEDISLGDAVKQAWQNRPELEQAKLNLKNAGIEVSATKNAELPTLNLFAEYQAAGLGGDTVSSAALASGLGLGLGGTVPSGATSSAAAPSVPGGLTEDWNGMIRALYPTFEAGLNLTLPVRNRAAQAQYATAQLNERQQEVQYAQTQATIVLSVRQALITLQQDRLAAAAAEDGRVFAQRSYDDEVRKLQLGASTAFTVVQKQQLLTVAEGTELRDRINLIEAELNFDQAMGRTLEAHHITIPDAGTGNIQRAPNLPGTSDSNGAAVRK